MEEKVLTEEFIENKDTLQSTKISLGKKIHLPWLLVALIFIVATAFSVIKYIGYNKGQETAVALNLAMFEATDNADTFDEYKDDYKELVNAMYRWYNISYSSYTYNGKTFSNGDVVRARSDADYAFGDVLTDAGYECYRGSEYFEYTDIFNYIINELKLSVVLYIIAASVVVLQLAFLLWYFINQKNSLTIDNGRIICEFGKKTTKEFLLKDVSSVDYAFLKGLKIKGNSIRFRIDFLSNAEELKSYIMDNVSEYKSENSVVASNNIHPSQADELKKYKDLLDSGVITQEEFDAKKKQLLDL